MIKIKGGQYMIVELKCKHCGKPFKAYECSKRLYCSKTCAITENWKKRERAPKVKFTCRNCGKEFELDASETRVKEGKVHYCSAKCRDEARKVGKLTPCKQCGKLFYTTRNDFCSKQCARDYRSANMDHKTYTENGYLVKFVKGYNKKGNVKLHRAVMEEKLGRRLSPDEIVHHIDGNKLNNDISNLEVMSRSDHSRLHREKEKENGKEFFKKSEEL
jgi:hypothetical protein